ncbi:hypothetical protein BO83DRAFT_428582 [Aspergillus eucalypticola CBS 122712]|uniref:Expansin-like EG45 domain-containing protein n=1 Tax=Aspergillus eucalypticola (strain CBS 122712 / IBT 29274) TaxID=1448314 RepID=A0A317V8D1_ASPEC|nr:uncharacterized protein BO83DRAFT_428582 [Aspergillus eucalypticola CBS 122712]PWY69247.1 hypothetical protein BO83DRAFT_428582 [Aspergillus eucalypticola CBS 122712]
MKYQRLASLGFTALSAAATVSANPLLNREAEGQCPQGYTQSVYYKTITLQPSSTAPTAPTSTLASVGEGQCPVGYTQSVYYKTITLQPTSTASIEPTSAPAVEPTSTPAVEPTSTPAVEPTSTPAVESSSTSVEQVTTLHSSSTVIVTEVVTATPAVATTSSAAESVAPVATTSVAEASPAAETSAAVEATSSSSSSVVEVTTNAAVNAAATTAAAEPTSEAITTEVATTEAAATEAVTSQAAAAAGTTEAATTQAAATTEAVVQSTPEAATTEAATQAAATTVESKSTSSSSTAASAATSSASSSSSSTSSALSSEYSGEATYYGGNVSGGTCSFTDYTIPSGLYGTALSSQRWDSAAECGACVEVTGPSGTKIKAMVVDECPECGSNHLDLFENAFSELADISKGVISIDWEYVACGITSPIELVNKSGTSAYWFAMQVVNSNLPVTKLEVSTDSGSTWQSTTRSSYNYFENQSGFGTDTVDVRVTAEDGSQITVKNVSVSSGSSVTASSNFE